MVGCLPTVKQPVHPLLPIFRKQEPACTDWEEAPALEAGCEISTIDTIVGYFPVGAISMASRDNSPVAPNSPMRITASRAFSGTLIVAD